jgi:allantoicase
METLIAELKVQGKSDLTLSVQPDNIHEYYIVRNGSNVVTYNNTAMGEANAMIAYERGIWERLNSTTFPGRNSAI